MSKKELFTTVLRGFHKAEVTRYLTEIIHKYEREKAEIDRKYAGMESSRAQKAAQEMAELQARLDESAARIALLEEELAENQSVEDTAYFQMRQRISELLSALEEKDAKLLSLRYGLDAGLPKSAEEVGKILGMTAAEVAAREVAALQKLRNEG